MSRHSAGRDTKISSRKLWLPMEEEKRLKSQNGNKYAPWFSSSLVTDHKGSFFTLQWDQWDEDWFLDLPVFVILTIHSVISETQNCWDSNCQWFSGLQETWDASVWVDQAHALLEYSVSGLLCYQMHFFFFLTILFQFKFLPSAKEWTWGCEVEGSTGRAGL